MTQLRSRRRMGSVLVLLPDNAFEAGRQVHLALMQKLVQNDTYDG